MFSESKRLLGIKRRLLADDQSVVRIFRRKRAACGSSAMSDVPVWPGSPVGDRPEPRSGERPDTLCLQSHVRPRERIAKNTDGGRRTGRRKAPSDYTAGPTTPRTGAGPPGPVVGTTAAASGTPSGQRNLDRRGNQGPENKLGSSVSSVVGTIITTLDGERRQWTVWVTWAMGLEALGLALLGSAALLGLTRTAAPVVDVVGFRLGYLPAIVFVVAAGAIAVAVLVRRRLALLRRVAPVKTIVFTILFFLGEVEYMSWQLDAATAFLFAGLALAGFIEAVLLNAVVFDPNPDPCP